MARKNDAYYFENFKECVGFACEAAHILEETLIKFDPDNMSERLRNIHRAEHAADEKKHEMLKALAKAFITPIEREDILQLSQNIDEMTDKIEDVMLRIYCNNIRTIRQDALTVVDLLIRSCEETRLMISEFANFRHSETLHEHIVNINTMEEEADRLFIANMRALHTTADDPVTIITWREIYIYLEKCLDACEHVADAVEAVVMKNS